MREVQKQWVSISFVAIALIFLSWYVVADQQPVDENGATPQTNPTAREETPTQDRVPFAADETLYEGDDIIVSSLAPLVDNQGQEVLTLNTGLVVTVGKIYGDWILVEVNHEGNTLAGWVDRKHVSLISAESPGVMHKSIKDVPKRLAELHASSEAHLSRFDFLKSLQSSSAILQIDPASALAFYRRGYCLQMLGEYQKAIDDFNQAIELEPNYAMAYLGRGDALFSKEQYDQAIVDYNTTLKTNPKSAGAYYMRGRCDYAKGDYDQAIADFNAALEIIPNSPWAIAHRGDAQYAKNDYSAAIADFDKATQIDRTFDWAIARRGDVWLYGLKEIDRAIADYTFAHTINPHNSWAIHQRGHCLEKKKDYAQAVVDFAEAVEIDPEYWDFLANLAWLLSTCPDETIRDGNRAIELATRACQLTHWENSFALGTLAAANAQAGQFGEAVEFQKKAVEHASADYDVERGKSILENFRAHQPFRDE